MISIEIHKAYTPKINVIDGVPDSLKYKSTLSLEFTSVENEAGWVLTIILHHSSFDKERAKTTEVTGKTSFLVCGAPERFFQDKKNPSLLVLCAELAFGELCYLRGRMAAMKSETGLVGIIPAYSSLADITRKLKISFNISLN